MNYDLLSVQSLGDPPPSDALMPIFLEGWALQLAQDEKVVWRGRAGSIEGTRAVNGKWSTSYDLDAPVEVIITDRRIVYLCRKYKKGGSWFGGGLAIFMMVVEAAWAAFQRRGKAGVGQVRYDWPVNIIMQSEKLGPIVSKYVALTCRDSGGTVRVKLGISKAECEEVAALLAKQIAAYRGKQAPTGEEKIDGRVTATIYSLPGAREVAA